MEDNLFLLLRIGLETEQPYEEALRRLADLSAEQWGNLREMAERQGVSAIVLDGLNALCQRYDQRLVSPSFSPKMWKRFLVEWMGRLLNTEQKNIQQRYVMDDLAKKWTKAGCAIMVMKGQANAFFYPSPLHRSMGDIDCYLFENYAKGNDIARELGADVDESWYKHSVIKYRGETFENHQYFVTTRSGKEGKLLNKELVEELLISGKDGLEHLTEWTLLPPVQWTAMFLTYHACSHFISEGLRLKQLLDWALFLKKYQNDVDWPKFYAFCERHHLSRFADVSTTIAKDCIGVLITNNQIRTDNTFIERVLHSVFYDDDFVFGSGKGNWHNRFHLVKNLWTYRWKYRDIYQMSPLRKLWYYATGYIFRTE